jgi:hypothetical protein
MHPLNLIRRTAMCALLASALAASGAHAAFDTNLIVNAGADAVAGGSGSYASNLPGWSVTGELTAIDYSQGCLGGYPCTTDPVPADHGANFFGGGNVGFSKGVQTIDLGFAQGAINGAGAYFNLSGWLGGYASQTDNATLSVSFLNAANEVIGGTSVGPVSAADRGNATSMLYRETTGWLPTGATSAQVELAMSRTGGTSNDGYADSLSLALSAADVEMTAPSTATAGSTFDVTVAVMTPFAGNYAGDELLAFGFDLGFDASLVRLTGITMAAPWDDDSALLNDVDVAGSTFESILDAGQATLQLATLSFEALAAGDVLIDVHSHSADSFNHGLVYALGDSVDLYGRTQVLIAAVPEPGEWLMFSAGLLVLVSRRRRR